MPSRNSNAATAWNPRADLAREGPRYFLSSAGQLAASQCDLNFMFMFDCCIFICTSPFTLASSTTLSTMRPVAFICPVQVMFISRRFGVELTTWYLQSCSCAARAALNSPFFRSSAVTQDFAVVVRGPCADICFIIAAICARCSGVMFAVTDSGSVRPAMSISTVVSHRPGLTFRLSAASTGNAAKRSRGAIRGLFMGKSHRQIPLSVLLLHFCYGARGEPAGQSLRCVRKDVPGRKVRAPVDRVPGNAWGARAHGKCNRKQTAEVPPGQTGGAGKGERVR